ncbi:MAG: lipid-A-disaccharide synthase N-terminal domain-containing protein [Acidobacteria bacterium]|nr:lipid-A-disaccharide synthase N-terminal domain-containing protein [Acidobacteriota bacterium]
MSLNPAEWDIWVAIGFLGQLCFSARFLIQWVSSERERKSVIPIYFWYFSLIGGMILAVYAFHRRDPVFLLGQSMGILIYVRNLMLIHRARRAGKQPGLPEIPV